MRSSRVLHEVLLTGLAWVVLVLVVVWMALCQEWSDMRWAEQTQRHHHLEASAGKGGTPRYMVLGDLALEHMPVAAPRWLADVLTNTAALAAVAGGLISARGWQARAVLLRRIGWIMAMLYLLRSVTISVTTMPPSVNGCVPRIAHSGRELLQIVPMMVTGKLSGCTDKLFSGHTAVLVMSFLIWTRYAPHWLFVVYSALHTLAGAVAILAVRLHYSVDVVLAAVLTFLVHHMYYMLLEAAVCERAGDSGDCHGMSVGANAYRRVAADGCGAAPDTPRYEEAALDQPLELKPSTVRCACLCHQPDPASLGTRRRSSMFLPCIVAWMDGLHLHHYPA